MPSTPAPPPTPTKLYEGPRVRLRPLRAEDKEKSKKWRNDAEVRDAQLGYRFPITEEMESDWIEGVLKDQSRSRCIMAIEDKSDDTCIGFVHLQDIDWINQLAELGISIGDKERHNKGLAPEVLDLILAHAFQVFNLRKVWVRVAAYNTPALRLFEKCGFAKEGTQRQHVLLNGRAHDLILLGLLDTEFKPTTKA